MTELSPEDSRRRSAALNAMLSRIENAPDDPSDWWNMTRYAELGYRTPTRAWLDGDHARVEVLVASWYTASQAAAVRHQQDPEFIEMLRSRSAGVADERSA